MEKITKKELKIIADVQKKISSCGDCESWDNETKEPFWIWGEGTDMYDLLDNFDLNIERKNIVARELKCPCGAELELMSKIGTKRKYALELEKHISESMKKYGNSLKDFEVLIRDYPLLALSHTIGKKIFSEVSKKKMAQTTIIVDTVLYRSRLSEGSKILGSNDFFNAPLGIPTEGRFNHNGQSYLYLCSKKEGAICEVALDGLVWVQEFVTSDEIDNILDLQFDLNEISTSSNALLLSLHLSDALVKNEMNNGNWKPDYFVTRFIMDCAKQSGYNGIRYDSIKSPSATNYVLFYPERILLDSLGKPEIVKQEFEVKAMRDFDLLCDL